MIEKERSFGPRGVENRRPPSNETVIRSEKIQIERKTFLFTLKENPRGRFLRITEDVGGRRDSIIVPATGLTDFRKALEDVSGDDAATEPAPAPPDASVDA